MSETWASIPDHELYERCLAGDESAWRYTYNYVLKVCENPRWHLEGHAEDLAQTIVEFLLTKGLQKVEQPQYFRRFVKVLAINKIKDSFKQKAFKYEICVEDETMEIRAAPQDFVKPNPGPDNTMMQKELIAAISRELLNLPEFCRKVMPGYFRYKLGMIESYQELSHALDLPSGTISSYVYRCLKILKQSKALNAFL